MECEYKTCALCYPGGCGCPKRVELQAKSALSDGLSSLVRINPKISGTEESPEPSIGELITKYYADQGMEDPVQLTADYLAELARMAR